MREKESTCRYEALEELSTGQLDAMLQEELRRETPNEEVVLPILQVLRSREEGSLCGQTARSAAPKRKWIVRMAAAVAVVLLLFMAVPDTVGAESIFDVLFRWTGNVFQFLIHGENTDDPSVEYEFRTDNPGLQQLYDKVVEMGITEPVVPMWLPEGYELTELKVTATYDTNRVIATFEKGNSIIAITYLKSVNSLKTEFEKNDAEVEVYEIAGTSHFLMSNAHNMSAIWMQKNVEVLICADVEKSMVMRIIESIYR